MDLCIDYYYVIVVYHKCPKYFCTQLLYHDIISFFFFSWIFYSPDFFPVFRERRRASRTLRKFALRLGRRAALLNVWEGKRAARDTSYWLTCCSCRCRPYGGQSESATNSPFLPTSGDFLRYEIFRSTLARRDAKEPDLPTTLSVVPGSRPRGALQVSCFR